MIKANKVLFSGLLAGLLSSPDGRGFEQLKLKEQQRKSEMYFYETLFEDRDLGRITDAVYSTTGDPVGGNWSSSDFSF